MVNGVPTSLCHGCYISSGGGGTRGKIRLEHLLFAEVERVSRALPVEFFDWSEPTSWDCAVFPESRSKPDFAYVFGEYNQLFQTAGSCKLDAGDISHVIILECNERSMQHHSQNSHVSDVEREEEIRAPFNLRGVAVDFLYVVVAAFEHGGVAADDRFFRKTAEFGCYEMVPSRKSAFQERARQVVLGLQDLRRTFHEGRREARRVVIDAAHGGRATRAAVVPAGDIPALQDPVDIPALQDPAVDIPALPDPAVDILGAQ